MAKYTVQQFLRDRARINLNYSKAIRQAEELERIASEMERLADREMDGTLSLINRNWQSENATLCIGKGRRLQSSVKTDARRLRSIARAIRVIARRTRDADLRAKRIAMVNG